MKSLVEAMAKSLVDNTSEVSVSETFGEKTVVLALRVSRNDVGKIIGKQGNTARAIRTVLSAAGNKLGRRYVLEIVE